jgi:hypothetical protein
MSFWLLLIMCGQGDIELIYVDLLSLVEAAGVGNHWSHLTLAASLNLTIILSASSKAGRTSKWKTGTPGTSSGAS